MGRGFKSGTLGFILMQIGDHHIYSNIFDTVMLPRAAGSWAHRPTLLHCENAELLPTRHAINHDKARSSSICRVFFPCLFVCPLLPLMEHHLLLSVRSSMMEQDARVCQMHHLLPRNVSNWPLLLEQKNPNSSRYYQRALETTDHACKACHAVKRELIGR